MKLRSDYNVNRTKTEMEEFNRVLMRVVPWCCPHRWGSRYWINPLLSYISTQLSRRNSFSMLVGRSLPDNRAELRYRQWVLYAETNVQSALCRSSNGLADFSSSIRFASLSAPEIPQGYKARFQVREVTAEPCSWPRLINIAIFIVCHVTAWKEPLLVSYKRWTHSGYGAYLKERHHGLPGILRAVKNRLLRQMRLEFLRCSQVTGQLNLKWEVFLNALDGWLVRPSLATIATPGLCRKFSLGHRLCLGMPQAHDDSLDFNRAIVLSLWQLENAGLLSFFAKIRCLSQITGWWCR